MYPYWFFFKSKAQHMHAIQDYFQLYAFQDIKTRDVVVASAMF